MIVRKGRVEPETVVVVWPKARFKRQNGDRPARTFRNTTHIDCDVGEPSSVAEAATTVPAEALTSSTQRNVLLHEACKHVDGEENRYSKRDWSQ